MPILNLNPDSHTTLEKRIRRLEVTQGEVLVTETNEADLVKAEEARDYPNTPALSIYSPQGANVAVFYFDETVSIPDRDELEGEIAQAEEARDLAEEQNRPTGVEAAEAKIHQAQRRLATFHPESTVRGDNDPSDDKETGSYEARSVASLKDLAKERGVEVKGKKGKKPVKADYVKALRG